MNRMKNIVAIISIMLFSGCVAKDIAINNQTIKENVSIAEINMGEKPECAFFINLKNTIMEVGIIDYNKIHGFLVVKISEFYVLGTKHYEYKRHDLKAIVPFQEFSMFEDPNNGVLVTWHYGKNSENIILKVTRKSTNENVLIP